jgi:hypothetical protein
MSFTEEQKKIREMVPMFEFFIDIVLLAMSKHKKNFSLGEDWSQIPKDRELGCIYEF